jgi:hypothetical protein
MTENYKAELNLLTRQGLLCLLYTPFTVSNLDQNLLPPRVANNSYYCCLFPHLPI